MEIGIVNNNYSKIIYRELTNSSNVDSFMDKQVEKIKSIRTHQGKRVVVYDVYDVEYGWSDLDRCYNLFCRVKYKIID